MPFSPAIEACRVPDERLAGAYEETSAAHRSWIKTTLALAEATYPAPPSRLTITSENAATGFGFARTRETAPWAVLLIGEGYASAVRLAAAIMPARLAGVEPVFAVWTGAETAPSGLFAALELTGVEQVFAMRDPAPLLRELPGRGRILRFGKAPLPECPASASVAGVASSTFLLQPVRAAKSISAARIKQIIFFIWFRSFSFLLTYHTPCSNTLHAVSLDIILPVLCRKNNSFCELHYSSFESYVFIVHIYKISMQILVDMDSKSRGAPCFLRKHAPFPGQICRTGYAQRPSDACCIRGAPDYPVSGFSVLLRYTS